MEQKDKELLLRDLSARLPYGVKVRFYNHWEEKYEIIPLTAKLLVYAVHIEEIPPYLFPLSSMTEEQLYELREMFGFEIEFRDGLIEVSTFHHNSLGYLEMDAMFEWFNRNHFDYRCLIEKSLALDATNLGIYE